MTTSLIIKKKHEKCPRSKQGLTWSPKLDQMIVRGSVNQADSQTIYQTICYNFT